MTHLNPPGQLKAYGTWLQKEEKLMTISFKSPPFSLRLPLYQCLNHQRNHKVYKMDKNFRTYSIAIVHFY